MNLRVDKPIRFRGPPRGEYKVFPDLDNPHACLRASVPFNVDGGRSSFLGYQPYEFTNPFGIPVQSPFVPISGEQGTDFSRGMKFPEKDSLRETLFI